MCAHFPIEMPNTKSENFPAAICCFYLMCDIQMCIWRW